MTLIKTADETNIKYKCDRQCKLATASKQTYEISEIILYTRRYNNIMGKNHPILKWNGKYDPQQLVLLRAKTRNNLEKAIKKMNVVVDNYNKTVVDYNKSVENWNSWFSGYKTPKDKQTKIFKTKKGLTNYSSIPSLKLKIKKLKKATFKNNGVGTFTYGAN
jgi:uncharacterized protein involved in tolerance to divalent cations